MLEDAEPALGHPVAAVRVGGESGIRSLWKRGLDSRDLWRGCEG